MSAETHDLPTPATTEAETLKRHGITCIAGPVYLVDGYRYASLADAVAQARRRAGARAYFRN